MRQGLYHTHRTNKVLSHMLFALRASVTFFTASSMTELNEYSTTFGHVDGSNMDVYLSGACPR